MDKWQEYNESVDIIYFYYKRACPDSLQLFYNILLIRVSSLLLALPHTFTAARSDTVDFIDYPFPFNLLILRIFQHGLLIVMYLI